MRQFLVLGYATKDRTCVGEPLHLGSVRSEALKVLNEHGTHARRTYHDLSEPQIVKHYSIESAVKPNKTPSDDLPVTETEDETEEEIGMSNGARELAESVGLTDEQLAEIVPSGATGDIIKSDIEDYIDSLTNGG